MRETTFLSPIYKQIFPLDTTKRCTVTGTVSTDADVEARSRLVKRISRSS